VWVYRDIARATDEQLARMREAISKLRDYEHFPGRRPDDRAVSAASEY
jgi:hypothetical protein